MKTSDKILTFSAIFISCLALVVSIMQTRIMQKQSHAAVWPRLDTGYGYGSDYFKTMVRNQGVGPAIVTEIEYSYKDSSFQNIENLVTYFIEVESKNTQETVQINYSYSNIAKGQVIGASEVIEIFKTTDSTSVAIIKKYLSETNISLDYCSIYETCWRMQHEEIIAL